MNDIEIFEEFVKYQVPNIKKTDSHTYIFCFGLSCGACKLYSKHDWCDSYMPSLKESEIILLREKYPEVFI